ncbi:MAG: HD domain-containing protein, partial [Promethearchaeia archaeon]
VKMKKDLKTFAENNKGKETHLLLQEKAYESFKDMGIIDEIEFINKKAPDPEKSRKAILDENIKILNRRYSSMGIRFELREEYIDVIESQPYNMKRIPEAKGYLKFKFNMDFNPERLWFIPRRGIQILKEKKIKKKPSASISNMKTELYKYIDMLEDFKLKMQILEMLEKHDRFYTAPAAKFHHHPYKGGLLEHTIQVTQYALNTLELFDDQDIINKDLLIAGCILHDFGKIYCYEISNNHAETTEIYQMMGHINYGIKVLSREITHELLDEILHILSSHHGIEQGDVKPYTLEAKIVSKADNLSAEIG